MIFAAIVWYVVCIFAAAYTFQTILGPRAPENAVALSLSLGLVYAVSVPAIFFFIHKSREAQKARNLLEDQARKARELQEKERAKQIKIADQNFESANSKLKTLESIVADASQCLQLAEEEFEANAYSPFWSAVDDTASALNRYNSTVLEIQHHSDEYKRLSRQLALPPRSHNLSNIYPDPTRISIDLNRLIRRGQTDFRFAQIFEQRNTNKVLQKSFFQLFNALDNVSDRLEVAVDNLGGRMQSSLDREGREEFERDVSEKLDNIQRGEKPIW